MIKSKLSIAYIQGTEAEKEIILPTIDYREKAHLVLDKIHNEELVQFICGLITKFYVKWEGGTWDE